MNIREVQKSDFDSILSLNNQNTPAVSELDLDGLHNLFNFSLYRLVLFDDHSLIGFCFILGKGETYTSDNYRWVSENYDNFEYLDRIVIADEYRGKGYGRAFYEFWSEKNSALPQLLEVNIKPMNRDSILFHEKLGFVAVGEQDTEGGKKRVQYMARNHC